MTCFEDSLTNMINELNHLPNMNGLDCIICGKKSAGVINQASIFRDSPGVLTKNKMVDAPKIYGHR
jgi:hypothetical protein